MFSQRCTQFLATKPAISSPFYLNRAGRTFSTTAAKNYETILTSIPKPSVGLSTWLHPNISISMTGSRMLTYQCQLH